MGGVAASGGYWMAMNCTRIVASPATITGSIGVIGGKFAAGKLLNRYGVTADELRGLVVQVAFYAGWPCGVNAARAGAPIFEESAARD